MRVAITCHLKDDGSFGLFETGVRQTAVFLYKLLRQASVEAFLVYGPGEREVKHDPREFGVDPSHVLPFLENCSHVVTVSRKMTDQERHDYRTSGASSVLLKCAPTTLATMQQLCARTDVGAESYEDRGWYDEVWIMPHVVKTQLRWCELVYKSPVKVVPHIWDPTFVPQGYGYKRQVDQLFRIAVMEPNESVTRTAHWPLMVVARGLERTSMIGQVSVLNAAHLKDDTHFMAFVDRLGLYDNSARLRTHLHGRLVGPSWFRDNADVLVTHSWENDMHYTMFEALWGGYPVVHSSKLMETHGYYYPTFDASSGGIQLARACAIDSGRHDPERTVAQFKEFMPDLQNATAFVDKLSKIVREKP